MYEILTNEWTDAVHRKPWKDRLVLCRMSDGRFRVLSHNGFYWVDEERHRVVETVVYYVTHFYVFEKFREEEIL